jgi:hypothetical protein
MEPRFTENFKPSEDLFTMSGGLEAAETTGLAGAEFSPTFEEKAHTPEEVAKFLGLKQNPDGSNTSVPTPVETRVEPVSE